MLGKKPHVLEVAGRPAAHIRKCILQIARQSINHLRAPALCLLALQKVPPNVVTREIESGVMGDYDAKGHLVGIEVLSVSQRGANLPLKRAA